MFRQSRSGTNPPSSSLFHLLFPPLRVFMICRYQSKTNLPPLNLFPWWLECFLSTPHQFLRTLPPSYSDSHFYPLTSNCYSPQTITVFTSLPPHHRISLLLSTGKVISTASPLEKRLTPESWNHVCAVAVQYEERQRQKIFHKHTCSPAGFRHPLTTHSNADMHSRVPTYSTHALRQPHAQILVSLD